MLASLTIRDVVLVESLQLDFTPGLSVLTGETGAGKSILLDSLGLALGRRSDAGLVRRGASQAQVVAAFELPAGHPALRLAAENGLDADDCLILRRQVKADGGSRAFVNDIAVSASLLRDLGSVLVEIHGQHDERGLLAARGHRALLDAFGRHQAQVQATEEAYAAWRAVEERLADARTVLEAGLRDREWLEHAVAELDEADPQPGEEAELAEQRAAMMKGARLADELSAVERLVCGSDGCLAQLRQAARRLDRLAPELDQLALALEAIDRAVAEASDAEDRLAEAARALAYDPGRLEALEGRLFDLRALARKHRVEPEALPALAQSLRARAAGIEAGEGEVARLQAEMAAARNCFIEAARRLGQARQEAAGRLDAAVMEELKPLRLEAARFRTVIEPLPEQHWSASGTERVEFEVSTNPGSPFAPLIRIASGGELARFTLALKVALAEAKTMPTMIFDEIDSGVGGAVASAIGERLARLSATAQVLVVTHSPQVAARAQHQWLIAKAVDGEVTRTSVSALDEEARREEIARMLSGATITEEARAQASRLLAHALT
jgi:DNA repair protein RecN (Recombination protein N)